MCYFMKLTGLYIKGCSENPKGTVTQENWKRLIDGEIWLQNLSVLRIINVWNIGFRFVVNVTTS